MKKISLLLLVTLLITSTGCGVVEEVKDVESSTTAISSTATNSVIEDMTIYKVKVQDVKHDNVQDYIPYIGLVKPHNEFTISSRVEGVVSNIYFEEGNSIRQNDVIVNLRDGNGNNMSQIGQDMAMNNLENAKLSLENTQKKTKENIKGSELVLSNLERSLADSQGHLDKVKTQNAIIIKNAEDASRNLKAKLNRLERIVDLSSDQVNTNTNNVMEASSISFDNIYNGMELALFATLPSILLTLKNIPNIPSGLNGFENDVEDLQDDLDDIRRDEIDEMLDLVEDSEDFILDFNEYLNDEDVRAVTMAEGPTIQASLNSFNGQLQGYNSSLVNLKNTYNSVSIGADLQLESLADQLDTTKEQLKLQDNAISLSKAQTDLSEYTVQTNINNLRNQIEIAKNNIELTKTLSKTEIDGQKHNIEMMELNLKQANLNEGYLGVKSNVEGVISEIFVEKGQVVYPREPIAKIFSEKTKEVEIFIEPGDIDKINIGVSAEIYLQNSGDVYKGEVTKINPIANERTHLVTTTIMLKDDADKIIPNSVVNVDVSIRGNRNYVFLFKNNKAIEQDVQIGKIKGSKVEIISGIKIGDQIITEGNRNLKDNAKVEIVDNF